MRQSSIYKPRWNHSWMHCEHKSYHITQFFCSMVVLLHNPPLGVEVVWCLGVSRVSRVKIYKIISKDEDASWKHACLIAIRSLSFIGPLLLCQQPVWPTCLSRPTLFSVFNSSNPQCIWISHTNKSGTAVKGLLYFIQNTIPKEGYSSTRSIVKFDLIWYQICVLKIAMATFSEN